MPDARIDARFSVADKAVVITGGTSGIGEMLADAFVSAGARVAVVSRKAEACERVATAASKKGFCVGLPADLRTAEGLHQMAEGVRARLGRVDVLINNAGVTWGAPLEEYPDEAFDKVFALNVRAVFRATVELLPDLRAAASADDPARVINISSIEGSSVPAWENYAYPASKAALDMLTRQLAGRLAHDSITVNALAPGPFPSRMIAFARENADTWAKIEAEIPLGRAGTQNDIAGPAIFLASPAASYLTGVTLPVDGGLAGVR